MSKFDPDYEMILIDIPIAYQISGNTVSAIDYSNDNYTIPSSHQGVLNQFNTLITNANATNAVSSISSALTSIANVSVPSLVSYTISNSNIPSISNWVGTVLENAPKIERTYSSSMGVIDNVVKSSFMLSDMITSLANNFSVDTSGLKNDFNTSVSDFKNVLTANKNYINTYLQSNSLYISIDGKVKSVVNNLNTNMNYYDFLLNSAPNIAFSIAEQVSQYYINNLDIARKNFFTGYEKFAGKRIGMTNFIDIYTGRETLKTVKELKVNVYDKIFNAINEYFLRYMATQFDLIKSLTEFTISMNKFYMDTLIEESKFYGSIPSLYANILEIMSKVEANKYNLAIGYTTDVYRSVSTVVGEMVRGNSMYFTETDNNILKTALTMETTKVASENEQKLKDLDARNVLGAIKERAILNIFNLDRYKFDRSLEFLSHIQGVPNTINRGLSQFERNMSWASLGANTLASVGNMMLPFL